MPSLWRRQSQLILFSLGNLIAQARLEGCGVRELLEDISVLSCGVMAGVCCERYEALVAYVKLYQRGFAWLRKTVKPCGHIAKPHDRAL